MATEDDATTAKEAAPEADEQSVAADMQSSVATIVAAIVTAIKATSLRPPPERVVVEETPEDDDSGESFQERMRHMWGVKILGRTTVCSKCGAAWTEENMDYTCDVAVGDRALTQLGGCLLAAEGCATGSNNVEKGDYGWSPAFQAVKDLWQQKERLSKVAVEGIELSKKIRNTLAQSDELNGRLLKRIDNARVSLEAECAANADKVQMITRQCRERRAIYLAVERDDMARLREILCPPESDEPEIVEEPETKTVVLDAGPDHLKIVEIENVTALRAEHARMREAIVGLCEKVLAHLPCVCRENRSICHRHEIAETLDDFEKQAGVYEAKEPERNTDDVASHGAFTLAPGPWMKDQLVIRFDGPPGPVPGRFVEVEINGQSVNIGEWVQDSEYWLLVIRPDAIPPQKRPGDLESRRAEHIRALEIERDRLIAKYRDTKTQILNRTPCRCLKEGVQLAEPHLPTCPSKIVMTIFDEFDE